MSSGRCTEVRGWPAAAAGLGGGSANAATALWAANELSGRPATDAQLQDWAGDIGSDISVFFSHGAAYCTSRCFPDAIMQAAVSRPPLANTSCYAPPHRVGNWQGSDFQHPDELEAVIHGQ